MVMSVSPFQGLITILLCPTGCFYLRFLPVLQCEKLAGLTGVASEPGGEVGSLILDPKYFTFWKSTVFRGVAGAELQHCQVSPWTVWIQMSPSLRSNVQNDGNFPKAVCSLQEGYCPREVWLWLPLPLQVHLTHHPERMVQSQGRAPHTQEDGK